MTSGMPVGVAKAVAGTVTWNNVVINGGGFDMGWSIADDGTVIMRTDIGGAYKLAPGGTTMTNIATQNNLSYPSLSGYATTGTIGYRQLWGVPAAEIAPSNSSIIYMLINDKFYANRTPGGCYLYKSTDGGLTFTMLTAYPVNYASSSAGFDSLTLGGANAGGVTYKRINKRIGIDPVNPNVVYVTNPASTASTFTGSISGTTLTLGSTVTGTILDVGQKIVGYGVSANTRITAYGVGADGASNGTTYTVSVSQTVASTSMSNDVDTNIALVSFDGGSTFSNVPNIPTGTLGTPGACCWQFDRSSGTTTVNGQTVTTTIFCCVSGSGTWRSTDGGVSFSQISSTVGKDDPQYSAISSDGVFYISNAPSGHYSLDRYQSGSWTQLLTDTSVVGYSSSAGYLVSIAAHPTTAGVIVGMVSSNNSPHLLYSSNYGASFPSATRIGKSSETYTASNILWAANQITGFDMASGGLLFDPANPNDLYACVGQAAFKTTLTGSPPAFPSNAPTWTGVSVGVENAVCDDLIHESGSNLLQIVADFSGFSRATDTASLATAPTNPINSTTGTAGALGRSSGWGGAIDPQNHSVMGIANDDNNNIHSGFSTDGGTTWTPFSTNPYAAVGGVVPGEIMINNGVILWMSCPAASGTETTYSFWARTTVSNAGANWRLLSETSTPSCILRSAGVVQELPYGVGNYPGWGGINSSVPTKTGCADRSDPDTFYIYNNVYVPDATTVTMTSANPGVVTFASHSLFVGAKIVFTTTGSLPTNVTAGATYYVKTIPTGSTFTFSATKGGTAVDTTSGSQSGTHTCTPNKVKGIYKSTDAGLNFTWQGANSDPLNGTSLLVRNLKCVPGQNGYLFAATGSNAGATHPVPNNYFKYSTDGGANWTAVSNMLEVNAFGFGKAGPSGNPTLFVAGWYRSVYGIYMSENLGSSWTQLRSAAYGAWPIRNDAVQCMEGDKDLFGRVYVGFRGSGAVYSSLI